MTEPISISDTVVGMTEPSCWTLCPAGHLVPIWTASGVCAKCDTSDIIYPRTGLSISKLNCDCGHRETHQTHLCPASLKRIYEKWDALNSVAVSKPFVTGVHVKKFEPIIDPTTGWTFKYINSPPPHLVWTPFRRNGPPRQKLFEFAQPEPPIKMYTYQMDLAKTENLVVKTVTAKAEEA